MTNKEFFLHTMKSEIPIFLKVVRAVPSGKKDFKPHEKARSLGDLAIQLAMQPNMIVQIARDGLIDFGKPYADPNMDFSTLSEVAQKNWDDMVDIVTSIPDSEWDDAESKMVWPGGEWKTGKFDMAWSMLFDAIHHRGQIATYLRTMGEKVPGVYGGSADERV